MTRRARTLIAMLGLFALLTPLLVVFADGDETLGTPGIAIADGSGVVAAGVGLRDSQPGSINIEIPAGASVEQVLLYWEGQVQSPVPLPEIIQVDGNNVVGTLIGASVFPGRGTEQVAWETPRRLQHPSRCAVDIGSIEIEGLHSHNFGDRISEGGVKVGVVVTITNIYGAETGAVVDDYEQACPVVVITSARHVEIDAVDLYRVQTGGYQV